MESCIYLLICIFFVVNCTSTDLSIFFYFFTLFFHIVKYSSYCFVHYFCINKAMAKKKILSQKCACAENMALISLWVQIGH